MHGLLKDQKVGPSENRVRKRGGEKNGREVMAGQIFLGFMDHYKDFRFLQRRWNLGVMENTWR